MLSEGIKGLLEVLRRIGSQSRSMVAVLVLGAASMLTACGGTSDGATGTSIQSPSAGSGTNNAILKVLGAIPTSGTATLTVISSVSTASPLLSTYRRLVILGNGTSTNEAPLVHQITVDYDPVSGSVILVTDVWGKSTTSQDGATSCALVPSQNDFQLCNNTVTVNPLLRQITFNNTLLRGNNSTSTLSAFNLTFTAP
jgi:surface antigen